MRAACIACLLSTLAACGSASLDTTASVDDADATSGESDTGPFSTTPLLADPATTDTLPAVPAPSGSLELSTRGDALELAWGFEPGTASAGSRLVLELIGHDRPDQVIDELRPALRGTATRGSATLSVQAHQLAWRSTSLRARLLSATGQTLAITAAQPLAPMLAAAATRVEASDDGARFGSALAFSTSGSHLLIADPDNDTVVLRPSGEAATPADGERVPVAGLASALPGSVLLQAATQAAVLVITWQEADGAARLVILEPTAAGFEETWRDQRADTLWQGIRLAADGRRLDLLNTQGRHLRLLRTKAEWQDDDRVAAMSPSRPVVAIALDPHGEPVRLHHGPGGSAVLEIAGVEQVLPARWPAPSSRTVTDMLDRTTLPTRLNIDGASRLLAIATLERPSDAPETTESGWPMQVTPVLRLFSRVSTTDPWHLQRTLRAATTWSDARMTIEFGTRPAATTDTLMWHWARPSASTARLRDDSPADNDLGDNRSGPGMRGEAAGGGLIVLSTRATAQAFGIADRTDRPAGAWRTAFSLPADGVGTTLADSALPIAAAMPVHGTTLAFTGAPRPYGSVSTDAERSTAAGPVVLIGQPVRTPPG